MSVLKTEYVGSVPPDCGNYLVIDVMTREQWVAKSFKDGEGADKVLCGADHQIHDLSEYHRPNLRWIKLGPLAPDDFDKFALPGA